MWDSATSATSSPFLLEGEAEKHVDVNVLKLWKWVNVGFSYKYILHPLRSY